MTQEAVLSGEQVIVLQQLIGHLEQRITALHELCRSLAEAVTADLQEGQMTAGSMASSELFGMVETLTEQPELPVLGMGFARVLEHGTGGEELHWWYSRGPGQRPQKLLVGARAGHVSDYEISRSLWWQLAAQSTGTCIVGPYVDVSGTNEYVVTFSRAVSPHGQLAGVVAMDVRVGSFQSSCQPFLLRLPRPASVVTLDGDVIATNSGQLLGGTLAGPNASPHRAPISGTHWQLVVG